MRRQPVRRALRRCARQNQNIVITVPCSDAALRGA
jgi:hypothetical protein